DHAGAARAARRAVAERQENHRAGAAPDRGPRQRRTHGQVIGRTCRRDRRLPRAVRLESIARDAQTGLRDDLRILVMSATLDGARIANMLGGAPVIASEGRAFAVETRYLGRKADMPLERQMADVVAMALRADPGSLLAFLPGAAEIRRTRTLLGERID